MGRKLPPDQLELYRRCDEVLHYVWDPIGVAGAPGARDEYHAYLPMVFRLLVEGGDKDRLSQALLEVQAGAMGLPRDPASAGAAATVLLEWREWVSKHKDRYGRGE